MSDQLASITTQTLLWEGHTIEVSYDPCWLGNQGTAHMTITCIDPRGDHDCSSRHHLQLCM